MQKYLLALVLCLFMAGPCVALSLPELNEAEAGKATLKWELWQLSNADKKALQGYSEDFERHLPAAQQGDAEAQYRVGLAFSIDVKDYSQALPWLLKAAEQDHVEAQYELGFLLMAYLDDDKQAFPWLLKAAEQGHVKAQYVVAMMFGEGRGVEINGQKSIQWLQKASDQNFAWAQYALAIAYEQGEFVEQNPAKAIELYRQAAAQGQYQSQRILSLHYRDGFGVERDLAQAYMWTKISIANAGDNQAFVNNANAFLAEIEQSMTAEDKARAKELLAGQGYNAE